MSIKEAKKIPPQKAFRGGRKLQSERQHKFAIIRDIRTASNSELLHMLVYIAGGDDYDGCFTSVGEYQFHHTFREVMRRFHDLLQK